MIPGIANFVAIGQDVMSDGDMTPQGEKFLSPPLSSRRSKEDALRESLLDENHCLEHKVRELERANSSLRQCCVKKDSEADALQGQISEYEGQLQALRRARPAETRRNGDKVFDCETHEQGMTASTAASTQHAQALEELADELRRVRASSRQAQEDALALHHQAQDDADSLQIQLDEAEKRRRQLEAEVQSQGEVMKERELSIEAERKRFEERVRQLEEQRRAEAEAMMVERSGSEWSQAPVARNNSLLLQIRHTSTDGLPKVVRARTEGAKSCLDLEAQTRLCPTRLLWTEMRTPVMVLLIIQTLLAALRMTLFPDLLGLPMAIPISAGWYAWYNRENSHVAFVCIWGLTCVAFGLATVLEIIMISPPLFASKAAPAYNLRSLLVVLVAASQLVAAPVAWHFHKRLGEVGEFSDARYASSYATFEGKVPLPMGKCSSMHVGTTKAMSL